MQDLIFNLKDYLSATKDHENRLYTPDFFSVTNYKRDSVMQFQTKRLQYSLNSHRLCRCFTLKQDFLLQQFLFKTIHYIIKVQTRLLGASI